MYFNGNCLLYFVIIFAMSFLNYIHQKFHLKLKSIYLTSSYRPIFSIVKNSFFFLVQENNDFSPEQKYLQLCAVFIIPATTLLKVCINNCV